MASRRNQRRKAWLGKVSHRSIEAATAACAALMRSYPGSHFTPYRCDNCGRFHAGHSPNGVAAAMEARRSAQ